MSIPWKVEIKTVWKGLVLIVKRTTWRAPAVILSLLWQELKGFPYRCWDEPQSQREKLSQKQIAPALQLYRALLPRLGQEKARDITREAAIEGALIFLHHIFGGFDLEEYRQADGDEKMAMVQERGDQFFNATVNYKEARDDLIHFQVTHCLFPPLCEKAGYPELAPIFCQGDGLFFSRFTDGVSLERPSTLAEGGESCPFYLHFEKDADWKEES